MISPKLFRQGGNFAVIFPVFKSQSLNYGLLISILGLIFSDLLLCSFEVINQCIFFVFHWFDKTVQALNLKWDHGQLLLILFISFIDFLVLFLEDDQGILHVDKFDLIIAFGDWQIGDEILWFLVDLLFSTVI